jgi:hypothetical protein
LHQSFSLYKIKSLLHLSVEAASSVLSEVH